MKIKVNYPKLAIVAGILLLIGCGVAIYFIFTSPVDCEHLKDVGQKNIPRTSPYYKKSLDRDGDGYACEQ